MKSSRKITKRNTRKFRQRKPHKKTYVIRKTFRRKTRRLKKRKKLQGGSETWEELYQRQGQEKQAERERQQVPGTDNVNEKCCICEYAQRDRAGKVTSRDCKLDRRKRGKSCYAHCHNKLGMHRSAEKGDAGCPKHQHLINCDVIATPPKHLLAFENF